MLSTLVAVLATLVGTIAWFRQRAKVRSLEKQLRLSKCLIGDLELKLSKVGDYRSAVSAKVAEVKDELNRWG